MYVAPVARNPVVALAPLVLVAGAVGLSWYGYNYYQDYQLQERIEAQRQAALANQQAETPPPPPPWVTTPSRASVAGVPKGRKRNSTLAGLLVSCQYFVCW
jgi:hypothetical protein